MRPSKIVPPRFQGLALGLEIGTAAYINYELYRAYKGTHPVLSPKLEDAGIWPRQPNATNTEKGEGLRVADSEQKSDDVRWMNINGVPVPSFDMLTRMR
ncbi:hypothetical protein N0V90_003610 [Kalmusia sp. IMI 367209]|nr:hypothetical protein N0V90_003610 [Kalmusia sp. IMI 367209]